MYIFKDRSRSMVLMIQSAFDVVRTSDDDERYGMLYMYDL